MEPLKGFTTLKPKEDEFPTGQVCPLPRRGGSGAAKGAMGSAIVTLVL